MDSSTQFDVFTEQITADHTLMVKKEFKWKMKKRKIRNAATQVEERSLKSEIYEYMDQESEMVHDPLTDLELDLSSVSQMSSHDYQLNPYLVYVSAVTHMQNLKQRDKRFKFQYFKNHFLEFNGGAFVERPEFSIEMKSLMRRFSSDNQGFKLLSSSLFDDRSDPNFSIADRIKLLIANKFYGPYLMSDGKYVLAQMDIRGKQFGWMLSFTDSAEYQSLEIYLAEDG